MGPIAIRQAFGAVVADGDVGHAGGAQRQGVDLLQIQIKFFAHGADEGVGLAAEGVQHDFGHLRAGLKAAKTDVGADGGMDILGIAAQFRRHFSDGLAGNVLGGAPLFSSQSKIGVQSAEKAANAVPGSAVMRASHSG